ncbi:MAG TPA: metallophosphoesterase [Candidatus Nanoarchaeia archaeon]|nr:metallophosphoesterase [Candidatus Nanoarchaeia archaeon]
MNKILTYLSLPILVGLAAIGIRNLVTDEQPAPAETPALQAWVEQHRNDFLQDGSIHFGIVSDIEGHLAGAEIAVEYLRREESASGNALDAIIVAGDVYENEAIRRNPLYPHSTDNIQEMVVGLQPFAELGVPVFIIRGNHEEERVYQEGLRQLQQMNPEIFDISDATLDFAGMNIVGRGGYHDARFLAEAGRLLIEEDYASARRELERLQEQNEPIFFVTHGPPRATTVIDYVPGFGHVGDQNLTRILNDSTLRNIVHLHGHIHEGGGNEEQFPAGTSMNVASITQYQNPNGPRVFRCSGEPERESVVRCRQVMARYD